MEKQLSFLAMPSSSEKPSIYHKQHADLSWDIYIDGAARGNPGPAGVGVYVTDGEKSIIKKGCYLGEKTNNQAEYLALALAIFLIKEECVKQNNDCPRLHFISDSELLVKQMNKHYKIKNPILIQIKAIIDTLLHGCVYSFKHVLRDKNTVADELANYGVDKKNKLPTAFLKFLADCNLQI